MNELIPMKENIFSNKLSNVLKKLMSSHNINMNQLSKQIGLPLTTISRLVNDDNINPTISSLIPIADFFGVSLNQLMGIDPLDKDILIGRYSKKNNLWTDVPIITWEQATEWPNNHTSLVVSDVISTDVSVSNLPFALIVDEINWEGFFSNSVIIVDPAVKPDHGDHAVVVKQNQKRASLKQILIDDDKIYLRPLNKDYQTQLMDLSFKIIGVVVQVRMDRK